MPAKDHIHLQVKNALEKDGWKIIQDPLFIPVEGLAGLYVDLAAEEILSAEKNGKHIVIEIKGFGAQSLTHDFYEALGQALVYEAALQEREVDWPLYLAIPLEEFNRIEKVPLFIRLLDKFAVNIVVVDITLQKVYAWRTQKSISK
ncbi:MAG: fatty-acid oxidation protein subunit alpha [Saprospiraceae bacterium]|jgi:hypothetical protein|nr:fatty-acid oxidation protein subunit alpha [Saprospiraceae bacterium]